MELDGAGSAWPVDFGVLADICTLRWERRTDVLSEIIEGYVRQARPCLATMRVALEKPDLLVLARAAGSLRSASFTLGAYRLADLCRQLEFEAASGLLERLPQLLCEIDCEFGLVSGELRRFSSV